MNINEDDPLPPQLKPKRTLNYKEKVHAGIIKGGLRPVAKHKIDLNKEYELQKKEDDSIQGCWAHPVLEGRPFKGLKEFMDCHHPNGRDGGRNLLDYKWCCKNCHRKIHENPNKARELKLLNF